MERNPLTIQDLNFYYPYIRKIVEDYLSEEKEDISETIITKLIQTSIHAKMQNPKALKSEIDLLREKEIKSD